MLGNQMLGNNYSLDAMTLGLRLILRATSQAWVVGYWAVNAPSTTMASPVTSEAESEHSQATASAISSGVPLRPMGSVLTILINDFLRSFLENRVVRSSNAECP